MIYLWTDEIGWEEFELDNTAELEKRGITIASGAFIDTGARIADNVFIGSGARISSEAFIDSGTRIADRAFIGSGARISARVFIGSGAEISARVFIGSGARISDRVFIGSGAEISARVFIGPGAEIADGANPIIIYITGSRFPVSYWGEDRIDIGCQHRSINQWLTGYEEIANKHEFTTEQIAEYRGYVEFIASVHARAAPK